MEKLSQVKKRKIDNFFHTRCIAPIMRDLDRKSDWHLDQDLVAITSVLAQAAIALRLALARYELTDEILRGA